jgi:hypothetical protein
MAFVTTIKFSAKQIRQLVQDDCFVDFMAYVYVFPDVKERKSSSIPTISDPKRK